ncbi:MAG: 4Fe-4S binding protein [Candidatus Bathyarchaeota archaeon]|nr:MAG: 4Fe-4S binding protein [Candidatus Bathyarchaeota archaeon]
MSQIVRSFRPVVDLGKCIKCGLCQTFCPEGTVMLKGGEEVVFDYRFCKGCGVCANECPSDAISMVREA